MLYMWSSIGEKMNKKFNKFNKFDLIHSGK
jgi:hypothetical protein